MQSAHWGIYRDGEFSEVFPGDSIFTEPCGGGDAMLVEAADGHG